MSNRLGVILRTSGITVTSSPDPTQLSFRDTAKTSLFIVSCLMISTACIMVVVGHTWYISLYHLDTTNACVSLPQDSSIDKVMSTRRALENTAYGVVGIGWIGFIVYAAIQNATRLLLRYALFFTMGHKVCF